MADLETSIYTYMAMQNHHLAPVWNTVHPIQSGSWNKAICENQRTVKPLGFTLFMFSDDSRLGFRLEISRYPQATHIILQAAINELYLCNNERATTDTFDNT